MKESITKFDLEAAFKALDDIDVPVVKRVKANKPALTEIFSRKSKFDALMEEYYDVGNMAELDDAKDAREAEVAKAKLARIEKIVDLDAESPEDLLTSYVGKYIMQCPQCMTLFYKNPEDIEASEEDPDTVNVNEVCQHCGNESGYTLVGKVGEVSQEEAAEYNEEETVDVMSTEEGEELDMPAEESEEDMELDVELDELDLNLEDDEELELEPEEDEKKEESFNSGSGETLVEGLTEEADLEVSADEFEKLISSPEFKKPISDNEARAMMDELGSEDKDEEEVKESVEVTTELDESVKVNHELLRYAVINPDGTFAGVPCTSEEEARELAAQKDGRIIVELGAVKEGIFDSKEKKQKAYADAIKQVFGNDTGIVVNEAVNNATDLIQEVAERFNDDGDNSKTLALGVIKLIDSAKVTINKTPHSLVKNIIAIGQKYERDSVNLENLIDFNSKVGKLQNSSKDGYKAMEFLFSKLNSALVQKLDLTIKVLKREFNIVESCNSKADCTEKEPIEEGIFDKVKDKVVDKMSDIVDKQRLKSREGKADWVLANAMKNYNDIKADAAGKLVPDESNKRFKTFVVACFTDKYSNGKEITMAPSFNNNDLVISKVQTKELYKDADNIAKGWSITQGNGPAFIYLAKSKNDPEAVFLCEYFKGELKNDQLEKYFKVVKDHIKGAELMAKGGMNNEEESAEAEETEHRGKYLRDNLTTVMNEVEELQESDLENFISDSLVESYGNVAGFRLTECAYANNTLNVDGTIYFTSGNTRKTTYAFSEAMTTEDGKVSMRGLNEKLGNDKQFTITGYANDRKFITESFKATKK